MIQTIRGNQTHQHREPPQTKTKGAVDCSPRLQHAPRRLLLSTLSLKTAAVRRRRRQRPSSFCSRPRIRLTGVLKTLQPDRAARLSNGAHYITPLRFQGREVVLAAASERARRTLSYRAAQTQLSRILRGAPRLVFVFSQGTDNGAYSSASPPADRNKQELTGKGGGAAAAPQLLLLLISCCRYCRENRGDCSARGSAVFEVKNGRAGTVVIMSTVQH